MNTTTKTPVNSIVIPKRFVDICADWHDGTGDSLYAVSSTGNLTTGSYRPLDCDSDEEWYLTLWQGLGSDVGYAVRCARRGCYNVDDEDSPHVDYSLLVEFEAYVDEIVDRLSVEYGLDG